MRVYANDFEESLVIYREAHRVLKHGVRLFSRTFACNSWGDGTGKKMGHNFWLSSEGPLAGKGLSRFTALEEIPLLLDGFEEITTELLLRTMHGRQHEIKEWIITAVKP